MTRTRPDRGTGPIRVPPEEWNDAERTAARILGDRESGVDSIETDDFMATRHYSSGTLLVAVSRTRRP